MNFGNYISAYVPMKMNCKYIIGVLYALKYLQVDVIKAEEAIQILRFYRDVFF